MGEDPTRQSLVKLQGIICASEHQRMSLGGLGDRHCEVFTSRFGLRCRCYHTGGHGLSCEAVLRHDTPYYVNDQEVTFGSKSYEGMELETTT